MSLTWDVTQLTEDQMREALEAIVDKIGLSQTLANLSEIAQLKAEHIRENWQDIPLAKSWENDSHRLDRSQRLQGLRIRVSFLTG